MTHARGSEYSDVMDDDSGDVHREPDEVVGSLDFAQRAAVCSPASRLCIVASAGSGKTRVIVKRIEHLCNTTGLLPNNVVAITFTRKAGFELAKRLSKTFDPTMRERPYVGTLHSFAMGELSSYHDENRTHMRMLIEDPVRILEHLKIANAHKMARALSWCKTRLMQIDNVTDDNISVIRRNTHIAAQTLSKDSLVTAWSAYEKECKKRGIMDHDDVLIEYCVRLSNPTYAASRKYLYRHLFVDEFQDTTPLHMEIYRRLIGDTGAISVVGDPDQSIFSFAGSSDVYLDNFAEYFPGAETVFLSTNYRSTRANVEVSRCVVPEPQKFDEIFAPRASTALPQLHIYSDEEVEANNVLALLTTSHARGVALSDMAVLVRTNEQKKAFVSAANKLGMAFHRGRHVVTDPVAADILATIAKLRKKRRWKSIYDALDDIDGAQTMTPDMDDARREIFTKLRKTAREYMELFPFDRHGDVAGFFEFLESQIASERDTKSGFSILTFHQSKGLEFHTVVVSGFEQGLVPLYNDRVRKAEEARLAYVALSRASDELHITRVSVRTRHGRAMVTKPSEFLPAISEHISVLDLRNDIFSPPEALERIADIRAKYLIKKP